MIQTVEVEADIREGEELFAVIVGSDEGARVVWTPRFLQLPKATRRQVGELVRIAADLGPDETHH